MPKIIEIPTYCDSRGKLSVIEKILPFEIKRVFFIYGVDSSVRGQHRHHKTTQAAICISGKCIISNNNGIEIEHFNMDLPNKCLIIYPEDFHWMHSFSENATLLVLASEYFNSEDYIYESY
jgi:hypothetical protein